MAWLWVKAWALYFPMPGMETHYHPSQPGPPLATRAERPQRLQWSSREGFDTPAPWFLSPGG